MSDDYGRPIVDVLRDLWDQSDVLDLEEDEVALKADEYCAQKMRDMPTEEVEKVYDEYDGAKALLNGLAESDQEKLLLILKMLTLVVARHEMEDAKEHLGEDHLQEILDDTEPLKDASTQPDVFQFVRYILEEVE